MRPSDGLANLEQLTRQGLYQTDELILCEILYVQRGGLQSPRTIVSTRLDYRQPLAVHDPC